MKLTETGTIPEKIDFFMLLIKQDMEHYEKQKDMIKEWILSTTPSLNDTEAELLEELCEEYQAKSYIQNEALKEFQKTLFSDCY
ncbi:hypothetical protein [Niallia endozanthoxylica]|uniref:Uncharacterized protein n=1 Tax=Niallia endozanthoxylica TaxID=2036016 RepID=A0A5J5H4B1_9BACI|nr:hypothetical protein [Niallia endozanthoxylica]KAA9015475.1 hypothetical protein F4V44_22735 [Niallia endozanthoxylica]